MEGGVPTREAAERLRFMVNAEELSERAGRAPFMPTRPGTGYYVWPDGNAWGAVSRGFLNLAESPSGWGETPVEALMALLSANTRVT